MKKKLIVDKFPAQDPTKGASDYIVRPYGFPILRRDLPEALTAHGVRPQDLAGALATIDAAGVDARVELGLDLDWYVPAKAAR
ncbi:MAG: hypothetical protein J6P03_08555 [Opitutales bacterium]|nr:hypothetical protein [Opitutales bacterium]